MAAALCLTPAPRLAWMLLRRHSLETNPSWQKGKLPAQAFWGRGSPSVFLGVPRGIGLRFCPLFLGGGARQGFGLVVTEEQICQTPGLLPGRWSCSNRGPSCQNFICINGGLDSVSFQLTPFTA